MTSVLYGLFVVDSEASCQRLLCCSHSQHKLRSLSYKDMFSVGTDPNDGSWRGSTPEGEYPKFLLREMIYVI